MKTTVCTRIKGEEFEAFTPHCDIKASAATESEAINALCKAIRKSFVEGVRWDANAKAPENKDTHSRQLSGLWPNPDQIIQPDGSDAVVKPQEHSHG